MKRKIAAVLSVLFASATQASSVFINEIHYDNAGTDVGEFVEIAAPQGTNLDGWSLVLYNGSNGTTYNTASLSGIIANESNGYGFFTVSYPSNGVQNGAPDGAALIDASGRVVQFLSYEGSFSATNGPASGLSSVDIGVRQVGTPIGESLQLIGSGAEYADFTWQDAAAESPGAANAGQTFAGAAPSDIAPTVLFTTPEDGAVGVSPNSNIDLTFSEDVVVSGSSAISCTNESSISVTITGEGTQYTVDPDQSLPLNNVCTFELRASDVTDLDGEPDNLAEDLSIAFTVNQVSLVINEIHADPAPDIAGDASGNGERENNDEFVEIVNNGDTAVDLTGWTLSDARSITHTFEAGSIIEANCSAVIFGGSSPTGLFGGALVQVASSGGLSLNNGGDTLTLTNNDVEVVVTYGEEGVSDQSLSRNPDITGEAFVGHATIAGANGALFSPGTRADGSLFSGCTIPDVAPIISSINIEDGATQVSVSPTFVINFSEAVAISATPLLSCSTSGEVEMSGELVENTYTLQPVVELASNETCTLSILANTVSDLDGSVDTLAEDFVTSFTTAEKLACAVPASYTLISAIQGSGDTSPLEGQDVLVEALVTAVVPGIQTFFVQEQNSDADGDNNTSEGLAVFYGDADFALPRVNDVVVLRGSVSEFFGRTQLNLASEPQLCEATDIGISPSEFALPVASFADLERLEGMLVSNAAELTITDNFTLGRFGQLTLSNGRIFNPNNVFAPGSAENTALIAANELNRILLDDGSSQQNPDVVPFPTGGLSAQNTARSGDTISSVTGVMDFGFGDYRVIPTMDATFVASNPRTASPDLAKGNLTVASLNVLNYFNTIDGNGSICGPSSSSSCRGADNNGVDGAGRDEFERQTLKTVAAIVAMDADILGLMEIENDGFGEDSSIATLVNRVNAMVGADTYTYVMRDAPIGTDAITVALMYKPSSVSPKGASVILDSSNSIVDDSGSPLFNDRRNRPSLIQRFALNENGEELVISVNHLKSKGSGCGPGDDDANTGQGNCNLTRTQAAQALMAFLGTEFGVTPTLVIGDLNAYAKEDPINAILAEGYTDLALAFNGAEAYSYTFNGELGYLDHALASASLIDKVVDTTEWHINADEPIILDYNLDFKSDAQKDSLYAPDAYRMSDHDPVIVSLQLGSDTVKGDWDADGDVDINDIRGLTRAIQLRQEISLSFDFNDDGKVTYTDVRLLQRMCTRPRCAV